MAISGRKAFFGCLIGCGGMLLLLLIVIISFVVWLSRPGELLDTTRLMGDETVGYLEFTLADDDPAARELLFELIEVGQDLNQQTSPLPDSLQNFIRQQSARSQQKDIEKLIPMVAAWTLSHGADGELDAHLGTLSVEGLGNQLRLADWMMGFFLSREAVDERSIAVEKYNGESIYRFSNEEQAGVDGGEEVIFFMRGVDIFLVNDVEAARLAVDRINVAQSERTPTEFDRLYATVPETALRGALLNANGELRRLWDLLDPEADEALLDGIDREVLALTIDGGFVVEGDPELAATGGDRVERSFALTASFRCRTAGCAGSGLAERIEQLATGLREKDEALLLVAEPQADGLVVRGQARDIVGMLERGGKALVEKAPTFEEQIRRKVEETERKAAEAEAAPAN